MKLFTLEQLVTLLDAQDELNKKYSGENWRKTIPLDSFLIAVQTEVSEFYESAPRLSNWKWWRKDLKNDNQNMIIESIDVLHFALSVLMINLSKEDILNETKLIKETEAYIEGTSPEILKSMNLFFSDNIEGFYNDSVFSFYFLINSLAKSCNRTLPQIYDGYFKKNKLNQTRVAKGYQEGNYSKYNENGDEDNKALEV